MQTALSHDNACFTLGVASYDHIWYPDNPCVSEIRDITTLISQHYSSTVHEVAWQFNNLACSCGLMFDRVISTIAVRSLFSSIRLSKRTELY